MTVHLYFGIENLGLTAPQRDLLVTALRALGPSSDPSPARLCHSVTRPDGNAAIFEAAFDEDHITVQAFKNRLGVIFSVDPATIVHSVAQQQFAARQSDVVTFQRPAGTNRLRVVFFGAYAVGGVIQWPTWAESNAETRAYLAANQVAWSTP